MRCGNTCAIKVPRSPFNIKCTELSNVDVQATYVGESGEERVESFSTYFFPNKAFRSRYMQAHISCTFVFL